LKKPANQGGHGSVVRRWRGWLRDGAWSLLMSGCLLQAPVVAGAAWKACRFTEQPIACRDTHSRDGTVRILWRDGKAMTYRLVKPGFPFSTLRDSLGGLWEREVLIQGNAVFRNRANGNQIVVPLR
jgi:hypothetical protein